MLGKRRREYLYNTDVPIPARTKSRYASRTLVSSQKSICTENQEQSTSITDDPVSLHPRLATATYQVNDSENSDSFLPATTEEKDDVGGEIGLSCTQPLYSTSGISAFEYHANVLEFSLKHCLTKCAFEDLLKLITSLLPQPNLASPSIYKQNKFFGNFFDKPATEVHQYCTSCHHLFELAEVECPNKCAGKIERFLLCDIEQQLENTLSGKIYRHILHVLYL